MCANTLMKNRLLKPIVGHDLIGNALKSDLQVSASVWCTVVLQSTEGSERVAGALTDFTTPNPLRCCLVGHG